MADELAAGCDEVARQLDEMRGALTEHGFMEYLPLRFARAGKEDRFAQMAAAGVPAGANRPNTEARLAAGSVSLVKW